MYQIDIKKLIDEFNIPRRMKIAIERILRQNSLQDLDIESKGVFINTQEIEYSLTDSQLHKFKTSIKDEKEMSIGYFALIISQEGNRIDELFVIK